MAGELWSDAVPFAVAEWPPGGEPDTWWVVADGGYLASFVRVGDVVVLWSETWLDAPRPGG